MIMTETNKKIYTAEEIHTALVLCAVEYMKQWRSDIVDEKELKRNEMLKELGFTSSKSFSQSEEAVKASRKRMVFNWYYKNFTNCIFVRMEDFTDLLVKYNLTCGRLSSYTGEIPYENLVEIKQVSDKLKEIGEENQYSNKINLSMAIDGNMGSVSITDLSPNQTLDMLNYISNVNKNKISEFKEKYKWIEVKWQ